MNFIRILQLSSLILLEICGTTIGSDQPANCEMKPTNVDRVEVVVYINGETRPDRIWYGRYCWWRSKGFPYNDVAPVTVKAGAEIYCDENNKCNCPNEDADQKDCGATFQHVCLEQVLGSAGFLDLLCCSNILMDVNTGQEKGLQACIDEKSGLADKVATCLANQGDGNPQSIALQRAKEVADKKVDMANNTEPFFFYNGIFDKCISDDSVGWWLQKLCAMLKHNIAKNITQCVTAMGW